jgi:hypothetical protein
MLQMIPAVSISTWYDLQAKGLVFLYFTISVMFKNCFENGTGSSIFKFSKCAKITEYAVLLTDRRERFIPF